MLIGLATHTSNANMTVGDLKVLLERQLGIPTDDQTIFPGGQIPPLKDCALVSASAVDGWTTVLMTHVEVIPGGMPGEEFEGFGDDTDANNGETAGNSSSGGGSAGSASSKSAGQGGDPKRQEKTADFLEHVLEKRHVGGPAAVERSTDASEVSQEFPLALTCSSDSRWNPRIPN